MVGSHNVDIALIQAVPQSRTVVPGLDGRIPFDKVAVFFIITVGEPQMVDAHFSRDALLVQRLIAEKFQFARRRKVQHVQARVVFMRHFHRPRRRLVAHFRAANQLVVLNRKVFAKLADIEITVAAYQHFVLRMDGNQGRHFREDAFQRVFVVHQHISGRSTQKELHAGGKRIVDAEQCVQVVVRRPDEKTVIGKRHFRSPLPFGLQGIDGGRRRLCVRHVHKRSDTAGNGCGRLRLDVCLMG